MIRRDALPDASEFFEANVEHYRQRGNRARGKCPFHPPSGSGRSHSLPLSMDLDAGVWHCFGCNAGGDLFEFVMLRDDCGFLDAAKTLGALRPLDAAEAAQLKGKRAARETQQRMDDTDYLLLLRSLAEVMEVCERIRRRAIQSRNPELFELADQAIINCGADFILLKGGLL